MKKLIILLILGIVLIGMINAAADIAYIVDNPLKERAEVKNAITELGLTYEIITSDEIGTTNFDDYDVLVVNDDSLDNNWDSLPVNNKPAVLLNWQHLDDWKWVTTISTLREDERVPVMLNQTFQINQGLNNSIIAYNSINYNIYYLEKTLLYRGVKIAATDRYDLGAIVAVVDEGTTLTKGTKSTLVNATSIFFGMTASNVWTSETKQLFKNCLKYVKGEKTSSLHLTIGQNLISIPIILDSYSVSNLTAGNANIVSVRGYDSSNQQIGAVSLVENNKGYFIEASNDTTLNLVGEASAVQQTINLVRGMNLVGITSLNNIDLDTLPSGIIEVSRRSANGNYETATKYGTTWFSEFPLEPGKGYWFKVNQNGVVWSYTSV